MINRIAIGIVLICLSVSAPLLAQQPIDYFSEEQDESPCRWSTDLLHRYVQLYDQTGATSVIASVTDPYYNSSNSWGQGYDDMWGLKRINAENAWKLSTGEGALVAILDTGIDYNHTDLDGNIWTNTAELNGTTGVDDDGNGHIDDIRGWDFYVSDNDPIDYNGHGTHVAGIIGAEGDNNVGVIGVAYNCKLLPIRILNSYGGMDSAQSIASAIRYAANMGAKILNCSFALPYYDVVVSAFQYAFNKGCIIVAAAGNDYSTISGYPAILDYAITVGSINVSNSRSSFSNYGSQLDVVAPGEDILSLRAYGTNTTGDSSKLVPSDSFDSQYLRDSGTSMATPFVSGLAALMFSQNPDLTFAEFSRRLKFSSYDLGTTGRDNYYGWGRIDAFAALSHDWYDSGAIRTSWLTLPDPDNVIRYDYFESGDIQSRWLDSPDADNVIRYSMFNTGHLDSKWLFTPDLNGNIKYSYFNEDFSDGTGRIYTTEAAADHEIRYSYGFINSASAQLVARESSISTYTGGGKEFFYYSDDLMVSSGVRFEFDNGDVAEADIAAGGAYRITKYSYNSTTKNTAWFLWGDNVYNGQNNVVVERSIVNTHSTTSINTGIHSEKLVMDPAGRFILALDTMSSKLKKMNILDNSVISFTIGSSYLSDVVIDATGTYAYVLNDTSLLKVDLSNGAIVNSAPVGNGRLGYYYERPEYLAVTPDKGYACVTNYNDDTVTKINLSTFTTQTITVGDKPEFIRIDPSGTYAYVTYSISSSADNVTKIRLSDNTKTSFSSGLNESRITFDPTGTYAYVVNEISNSISIVRVSDNSIIKTISVGGIPEYVALDTKRNFAYVTNRGNGTVTKIDLTNYSKQTIDIGQQPSFLIIDPSCDYAYVTTWDTSGSYYIVKICLEDGLTERISTGYHPVDIVVDQIGENVYTSGANNITRIINYSAPQWKAYTFLPDIAHPQNVTDPGNWTFIEDISDPSTVQSLPPELGSWSNWCIDHKIIQEFPALSSVVNQDGSVTNYNPYMNTTYVYRQGGSLYQAKYIDPTDDSVQMIIEYYGNGTSIRSYTMVDTAGLSPDEYTYVEYDADGELIKKTFADGTTINYDPEENNANPLMPAADLDNDGKKEIMGVFPNQGSYSGIYIYNDGIGWGTRTTDGIPTSLTAADIDNDGKNEIMGVFPSQGAYSGIYIYNDGIGWGTRTTDGIPQTQDIYLPRGDQEMAERAGLESGLTQKSTDQTYTTTGTLANPPKTENLLPKL